jgi:hypothetical protein
MRTWVQARAPPFGAGGDALPMGIGGCEINVDGVFSLA